MSSPTPKPRARSTRGGRVLALRILYAADLSQEAPLDMWRRSSPELLFEDHLPLPQKAIMIEADRDAEPVAVSAEEGEEAQGEEGEEEPVLEGWDAVLAISREEDEAYDARHRGKEDVGTAAARLALEWITAIQERMEEIDAALQASSPRWKVKRMMPMDRNILRIGVFELLEAVIPPRDVIYDCVELGKVYGDKNTARFVNGVLDQFCRDNEIRL